MHRIHRTRARRLLRWSWICFLHFTGLLNWARRRICRQRGVVVLTLHRILDDESAAMSHSQPGMIVRLATYESLLRHVVAHCEPVRSPLDAVDWRDEPRTPRIAVTFDDGWLETAKVAFPVARYWKVPLTVFVCPGLAGKQAPFWPERILAIWDAVQSSSVKRCEFMDVLTRFQPNDRGLIRTSETPDLEKVISWLKDLIPEKRDHVLHEFAAILPERGPRGCASPVDSTMSWPETIAAAAEGLQVGSHTQFHQILTTVPESNADEELRVSKRAIENYLGRACTLFAYPNGNWSLAIRNLVEQVGYRFAFANEVGVWTKDCDPYIIPRVNVWEGMLTNPRGQFSPRAFDYAIFWRSNRAMSIRQGRMTRKRRVTAKL